MFSNLKRTIIFSWSLDALLTIFLLSGACDQTSICVTDSKWLQLKVQAFASFIIYVYSSSINLPWEEWFLCLDRKLDREIEMQICSHFQPVVLQKWRQWQNCEETKLWYALWKEVVINEQWWRRSRQSCFQEASQRCQQGVGQSGITTSSAPSSNLFNLHCEAEASHQKMHVQKEKNTKCQSEGQQKRHRTANHSLPLWFLRSMKGGSPRQTQIPNT